MGGGTLIPFLYLGCAFVSAFICGVGAILYVVGRRKEKTQITTRVLTDTADANRDVTPQEPTGEP